MIPGASSLGASSLCADDDDAGILVAAFYGNQEFLAALERTAAVGTVAVDEAVEIGLGFAIWNDPVPGTTTDIVASLEP